MSKTSLALGNLRAFAILLVVSFHSILAYLASQPALPMPFDAPPWAWRAFPMLDNERWFGFDLYCAFLFVFLMPFMFLLSGLFVWPSLLRKGSKSFLQDRFLRLGVPFVLFAYLLMPLVLYPVYCVTAADPSWGAYWEHLIALPFWPSGPQWFLWQLLLFDICAAALYRFVPPSSEIVRQLSAMAGDSPRRFFVALVVISALAYVPLALAFKPWDWAEFGPFSFQPGRILHYLIYFFAGLVLGAQGLERSLLNVDGIVARRWVMWVTVALGTFLLWMMITALTMQELSAPIPGAQIAADLAFVVSCAASCFGLAAIFLRFATSRRPLFDNLSENAYGIFLVHYAFVVWLQYMLLGLALPAVLKGAIVFAAALILSWTATIVLCRIPLAARVIRTERRASSRPQGLDRQPMMLRE